VSGAREGLRPVLVVRARGVVCALALADVVETLRAVAVEPLAGAPRAVRGVSVIRGEPVPVVDLAALLGQSDGGRGGRLVTVRVGDRRVALAVEAVLGVQQLEESARVEMPPLLSRAAADAIDEIGTLDGRLLLVLRAARLVPPEVWQALAVHEASA
jgi:purine-binding chemotaxis protein CheW